MSKIPKLKTRLLCHSLKIKAKCLMKLSRSTVKKNPKSFLEIENKKYVLVIGFLISFSKNIAYFEVFF